MMASEGDELPSDLIFEILSRTSLETLHRCKAVSKSWKEITYEPTFLPLHCERSNSLMGYFFQDVRYINKYEWAFVSSAGAGAGAAAAMKGSWPSGDMKILASCDQGILCCERQICYNKRYYTCKPSTAQWQALPNPKLRYETAAVAIVVAQSHPLRYIIARLHKSPGMQYACEIFDSKAWAWDKIECSSSPYEYEVISPCDSGVTTGGQWVHWLTHNDNIISVDVKKRCLRRTALPEAVRCKWKKLVEHEGGLGLICLLGDDMELWVGDHRKLVVDMRGLGKDVQPVDLCNTRLLFTRTADGAAFHNLLNGTFTQAEVPYELTSPMQIFRFRSDFEMVDLKSGRTSKLNSPTTNKTVFCGFTLLVLAMFFLFLAIFSHYFL